MNEDFDKTAWVKSLKIGDIVCDCRYVHSKIVAFSPGGCVEFGNGWGCDPYFCCEPADHPKHWFIYLLRCKDNSLYCGMTDNLHKRLDDHNNRKGAKYTRGRLPIKMVYSEMVESKSAALKREYAIKQLSRKQKLALIEKQRSQK